MCTAHYGPPMQNLAGLIQSYRIYSDEHYVAPCYVKAIWHACMKETAIQHMSLRTFKYVHHIQFNSQHYSTGIFILISTVTKPMTKCNPVTVNVQLIGQVVIGLLYMPTCTFWLPPMELFNGNMVNCIKHFLNTMHCSYPFTYIPEVPACETCRPGLHQNFRNLVCPLSIVVVSKPSREE